MDDILEQRDDIGFEELPAERLTERVCKILVIGVGGAGNNAVNRMIRSGITSAEFVAANTDKQDLIYCEAKKRVVLGASLTKGLGAGSNPSIGKQAAEETKEIIKELLQGVDLLFITAGMGGGTGTGAAPVIANIAHELGILTIAVVTTPFRFEGERRMTQALSGINELRQYVDTLLVVPNEKLLDVMPKGTNFTEAFSFADEVLRQGIQGIADLIVKPAMINRDFADVKTVLKEKGYAHIGIGEAEGENRTEEAVWKAVNNRLLETNISEATAAILFITGGSDLSLEEVDKAGTLVRNALNPDSTLIFGADVNPNLGNKVSITIIATGFSHGSPKTQPYRFAQSRPTMNPLSDRQKDIPSQTSDLPPLPGRTNLSEPAQSSSFDPENRIRLSDNDLPPFMRKLKRQ